MPSRIRRKLPTKIPTDTRARPKKRNNDVLYVKINSMTPKQRQEAYNILVVPNIGLIRQIVGKAMGLRDKEDAFQRVVLQIMASLPKFNRQMETVPWVKKIAKNYCLGMVKERARLQEFSLFDQEIESRVDHNQKSPPELLIAAEVEHNRKFSLRQIRRAVRLLPKKQGTALRLAYGIRVRRPFSNKEIAEYLGMSVGGVKSMIQSAKAKAKKLIQEGHV